jgi:hypothetical protein
VKEPHVKVPNQSHFEEPREVRASMVSRIVGGVTYLVTNVRTRLGSQSTYGGNHAVVGQGPGGVWGIVRTSGI